jgi:hypothetical protein
MTKTEKVKKKEQLPEWFSISKYLTIYSEEHDTFIRDSLRARLWLLELAEDDLRAMRYMQYGDEISDTLHCFLKGGFPWEEWAKFQEFGCLPPESDSTDESDLEEEEFSDIFNNRIPETEHVRPIKMGRGVFMGEICKHYLDSYNKLAETKPHPKVKFLGQILGFDDYHRDLERPADLHLNIDLAAPDRQILAEMKLLLPQLRLRYGMDRSSRKVSSQEHKKRKDFSPADKKKVIDYRIIPLIDLKIWEIENNKKITDTFLEKVLFNDTGKELGYLNKIVKPFFSEKIRNPDFISQWVYRLNE